jgi:DNA-directed RNA polymerase subunit M/transcription elongation factor TFIIS
MQQRGTRAFELTSVDAIDTARGQVTTITAVVDLTAPGVSDAHRLAAHLSVPLFTLGESGTAGPGAHPHSRRPGSPELVERDAISLSAHRYQDIALSRVAIAPCGPEPAALELLLNSKDPIRFDDTEISARLRNRFLEIEATTPGRPARHFGETRCALRVLAGRFIVVRDGTPTADLYGPLSIAAFPRRIARHHHSPDSELLAAQHAALPAKEDMPQVSDTTHCPLCGSEQIFVEPQDGGKPDLQGDIEFRCRCAACGHRWSHTRSAAGR